MSDNIFVSIKRTMCVPLYEFLKLFYASLYGQVPMVLFAYLPSPLAYHVLRGNNILLTYIEYFFILRSVEYVQSIHL
jgi:hypothetical protein